MDNDIQNEAYSMPDFTLLDAPLCLDFAHTQKGRITPHPQELLNSYNDLVAWSQAAQSITEAQATKLVKEAERRPGEATNVLRQAIAVREAIYRIFEAVTRNVSPDDADMSLLNTTLARAMAHACVMLDGKSFTWSWQQDEQALDYVLWPVVRSAADLLTSQELSDVRQCAASDCSGLFIDTSKNHSRRWCDMTGCGNREKARRHYARKHQA